MFSIGPWDDAAGADLDRVLGPPDALTAQGRPMHGLDLIGPASRRTLIARDRGGLVGVATVYESRFHPSRLWLATEVAFGWRRRGVGTALVAAVRDASSDERPLRTKVFANSPGALFARRLGWKLLQVSRTFRLPPTFAEEAWPGVEATTSASADEVAGAFLAFYADSHAWDPIGTVTLADMRAASVDPAVATILVHADDKPAAVGCVYDEDDSLLLSGGPIGEIANGALDALLDAALKIAANDRRDLHVEIDNSMTALTEAVRKRDGTPIDEVRIVAEH